MTKYASSVPNGHITIQIHHSSNQVSGFWRTVVQGETIEAVALTASTSAAARATDLLNGDNENQQQFAGLKLARTISSTASLNLARLRPLWSHFSLHTRCGSHDVLLAVRNDSTLYLPRVRGHACTRTSHVKPS